MLEKNREYDIKIDDLTVEGMGVGRIEGMAVFVHGLLPGERGRVLVIKKTKKYAVAKTLELYEPCENRIEPVCPVFHRCGGCSIMHLAYPAQLDFKQKHVSRLMAVNGGVDIAVNRILPSPLELHYRNKTSFPVKQGKEGLLIGCYAKRSHRVVDTDCCYLHHEDANMAISIVRKWMNRCKVAAYDETRHQGLVRHVVVRRTSIGEIMVGLVINGRKVPEEQTLAAMLKAEMPQVKTLILNTNTEKGNVILGRENRPVFGDGRVTERIGDLIFRISLNTFLQINHKQMIRMYETVMELAQIGPKHVVVDLYCGAGTMSLYSALRAGRVYGIEIVPEAVEDAVKNAKANHINNAMFICGDCKVAFSKVLKREEKIDVIIVDPPRKGLDRQVIEDIGASGAGRVVYVSCDPATLARDLTVFQDLGFAVEYIQPLDLFPMSTHVETIVLMSKVNPNK